MKVVLFCGGMGLRLRESADSNPKPMVPIGPRPVLWHVMRTYAHFGYKDFVLCLGYKAETIKQYFLRYDEALSNDFVLSGGGQSLQLLNTDIQEWRITFADTGLHANIASRLMAVRKHLTGEEVFLANYADVLTDAPLGELVEDFRRRDMVAAFLTVRPTYTFHIVKSGEDGVVTAVTHVNDADIWVNGGYFIMRQEIFDYMRPGDELVEETFARLIAEGKIMTYRYDGFWAPMDTLKDMQTLESLYESGRPPWAHWQR